MKERSERENREGIVLYRKYRPRSFGEVLGQLDIVTALQGALKEGRIAHAYLFSGSRGTGKTSVARIFAREIGTTENDLYEMDAASNRGIDEIRLIREAVAVLPFESRYKVYIIDEAHMLTKEAWNALLKTLEEPPPHAVFILATTEEEKVPETILSRCQVFRFKRPGKGILVEMIARVAKEEGVVVASAAAELVALLSEGSFRDALGVLEKVIASSGDKKISYEEARRITGAPRSSLVNDFLTAVASRDAAKGVAALHEAVAENVEVKVFAHLALQKFRFVLLLRVAPAFAKKLAGEFTEGDLAFLTKLSASEENAVSAASLYVLLEAYDDLGRTAIPELPLELALMKISMKHEA